MTFERLTIGENFKGLNMPLSGKKITSTHYINVSGKVDSIPLKTELIHIYN
jgi:hypothetical protein